MSWMGSQELQSMGFTEDAQLRQLRMMQSSQPGGFPAPGGVLQNPRVMSPTQGMLRQCAVCLEALHPHGPTIICTNCRREVHPHCMAVIMTSPVCHGCIQDQEQRQAYARGVNHTIHQGSLMARSTAHHAQLLGAMLGAAGASSVQGALTLGRGLGSGLRTAWQAANAARVNV